MDYVFYFVVTILTLVFVHELGHFLAAKLMGMRVDVFAIGFGKRLFGWNKISGFSSGNLPEDFDLEGKTDYRISMLPLGGYVKIAGMVDESFDNDFANNEPAPDEFRSKSTIAKLFVISAGVLMNFVLAIIIFSALNFFEGKRIYDTTTVGTTPTSSVAFEAGFRKGDKVISVNNAKVNNWDDVYNLSLIENFGKDLTFVVDRNGEKKTVEIKGKTVTESASKSFFLNIGDTRTAIAQVLENSPAAESGLMDGDEYIAINGTNVSSPQEVFNIIQDNPQTEMTFTMLRGEDTLAIAVTPGVDDKIGVMNTEVYVGNFIYKTYGFVESIAVGFDDGVKNVSTLISFVKMLFTGKADVAESVGGPAKIAKFAKISADAGLTYFLRFIAMLSITLAIMNLLPLPVLDGGHFVIILIEGVIRRELPLKVKIAIQNVGFILLMSFFLFVMYNDIMNW